MAEAREFLIAQDLRNALLNISKAGGYHHDVAGIAVRMDRDAAIETLLGDDRPRPFVILDLGEDVYEYPERAGGVRILVPFQVHMVNDTQATDDEARMRAFYRQCADIEQAIEVDTSRGQLATDTRVDSRQMRDFDSAEVWAIVTAQVRIHRQIGVPNV